MKCLKCSDYNKGVEENKCRICGHNNFALILSECSVCNDKNEGVAKGECENCG